MSLPDEITPPSYGFDPSRIPQDDDELWWALQGFFGVKVPRTQVCPHHSTPFAALSEAFFARTPVSVWWASRGYGGKSYLLSALALIEAVFLTANISLLGGSGAQSLNVHEHTAELWDWIWAPKSLLVKDNKFGSVLNNKASIRSLMASQTSVRGPHPQRLRLDEIDEMDYEILKAAQGQPMRKRGIETQTVMSSTWQYPDKTMSVILEQAKELGWPVHSWCYRETSNPVDGWLDPAEVERKKREIPRTMWDTEYELQEPSVENRAIDSDLVAMCFDKSLGEFTGGSPIRSEEPLSGQRYVTGVDWAKAQDWTVIATFRLPEYVCVSWQAHQKKPWQVMVRYAFDQWQAYGGELVHDATGLGTVVDDLLKDLVRDRLQLRHVIPITMSRGLNNAMYSEYIAGIERGHVKYPRIEMAYDEHRYATIDDLYGNGHTPDSFVAGALAFSQRQSKLGKIATAISSPKTSVWTALNVGASE